MARDWTREEVEATVADYFAMWTAELAGERTNKREHNRALGRLLNDRSPGAIEFKHENTSAVLVDIGYPYIEGYKPRFNYQDLLRQVVVERLAADVQLRAAAAAAVAAPVTEPAPPSSWADVHVPPPKRERPRGRFYERLRPPPARQTNYLAREAQSAALGAAGEQFVVQLEHKRLWEAGARRLAERIDHVSKTVGDGLGYDVLSFEPGGRERLIEVKTTRFGEMTPFFATSNEVAVSNDRAPEYHLYRLFDFREKPKLFVLSGRLTDSVELDPLLYRASIR